jgi:hypothetical protein
MIPQLTETARIGFGTSDDFREAPSVDCDPAFKRRKSFLPVRKGPRNQFTYKQSGKIPEIENVATQLFDESAVKAK